MASKTAIVNAALAHLGVSVTIGNVETDKTAEARSARTIYDITLDDTLSAYPWPFAKTYSKPGLVSTDSEDRRVWTYAYRYPADCIHLRKMLSDATVVTYPHVVRPTYEIGLDSQGKLILTNEQDIRIEYTKRVTNTELFSASFSMMFSYHLAAILAPSVTGGDPYKLGERAMVIYRDTLMTAEVLALNEEQPQASTSDEVSEFTGAR